MIKVEKISQTESADLLVKSTILSTLDEGNRIINCCENSDLGRFYIISDGSEFDLIIKENWYVWS